MKNLFIGNIAFRTNEDDLRSMFTQFGEIVRIQVITDRATGHSRGFAFVEMATTEAANQAMEALNGKEVEGRSLNVCEARPRPERNGGYNREGSYNREGRYNGRGEVFNGDGRQRREPRW